MRLFAFISCIFFALNVMAEDWPRWRGVRGDGTWLGPKIIQELPEGGLRRVWKAPLNPGYSGITVKGARVGLFRDIDYPDYPEKSENHRGGRMER